MQRKIIALINCVGDRSIHGAVSYMHIVASWQQKWPTALISHGNTRDRKSVG